MLKRLLIRISHMYYNEGLTQSQIANKLNLSRMQVSRYLRKSRETGIVKIIIDYSGLYFKLESDITNKYNLKQTIIVDDTMSKDMKENIAQVTANYLKNFFKKNSTVALGWGSTLSRLPKYMDDMSNMNLLFTPIIGGHGKSNFDWHASTIASNIAKKTGAKSLSLLAPALVKDKREKEILMNDIQIKEVINQSKKADVAIFSLGFPLNPNSSINKSGYFSKKDLTQLKNENAVCDIVSILFLNQYGEKCCSNITDRSIGINEQDFKNIPIKICIVEGLEKANTTKIALKCGYVDILITDKNIADFLMT
jgi:deoxyribonucleoside regulator